MSKKWKNRILVLCLFAFLIIVLGGGLHLTPAGAVVAAATGTPLMVFVFRRFATRSRSDVTFLPEDVPYDPNEPAGASRRRRFH